MIFTMGSGSERSSDIGRYVFRPPCATLFKRRSEAGRHWFSKADAMVFSAGCDEATAYRNCHIHLNLPHPPAGKAGHCWVDGVTQRDIAAFCGTSDGRERVCRVFGIDKLFDRVGLLGDALGGDLKRLRSLGEALGTCIWTCWRPDRSAFLEHPVPCERWTSLREACWCETLVPEAPEVCKEYRKTCTQPDRLEWLPHLLGKLQELDEQFESQIEAGAAGREADARTTRRPQEGKAGSSDLSNAWTPRQDVLDLLQRIRAKSADELKQDGFHEFVAESEAARRAATAALQFLNQDGPILIVAPTGCGKEMLVRDLHGIRLGQTTRAGTPFLVAGGELGAEPEWGKLVGTVKGAATGVAAREGMIARSGSELLVIDEFHAVPGSRQHNLLRLLDPKNPDYAPVGSDGKRRLLQAKSIACTSENLWQMAKEGRFHEPLLQRFSGRIVWIPPLHERLEDIIGLLQRFLAEQDPEIQASEQEAQAIAKFAVGRLWDGRDLRGELDTRLANATSRRLPEMFPEIPDLSTSDQRRKRIMELLKKHNGNTSAASQELYAGDDRGPDTRRQSLRRECNRLGLVPSDYKT